MYGCYIAISNEQFIILRLTIISLRILAQFNFHRDYFICVSNFAEELRFIKQLTKCMEIYICYVSLNSKNNMNHTYMQFTAIKIIIVYYNFKRSRKLDIMPQTGQKAETRFKKMWRRKEDSSRQL